MKRFILFYSMLSLSMGASQVGAEIREFTSKDGTAIYGELVDYNVESDVVKIKTDKGKTVQTKASSFMDEDFMYIRDWDAVRLFSQNAKFRIYLTDAVSKNKWAKFHWRRGPGKTKPSKGIEEYFNRLSYEIKFDNQTGYDLENIEIKYCIYYEQDRMDFTTETKINEVVTRPSIHEFAIIPNGVNKKFESFSVVLRRKELITNKKIRYLEGEGRFLRSKMIGMVFRASIATLSGQTAIREIRLPKGLSEEYAWVEPTEENTVWPDDDLEEIESTKEPPTRFREMGGSDGDEEE